MTAKGEDCKSTLDRVAEGYQRGGLPLLSCACEAASLLLHKFGLWDLWACVGKAAAVWAEGARCGPLLLFGLLLI